MATTKAGQQAVNRYIAKAYDRVNLTIPKGEKETIRAFAKAHGESVNAFILRAVKEAMARESV